jgi:2-polyprenyl-3-methyl-5-hydroxy-6-metoxy-1,4-benzoquinol methylase
VSGITELAMTSHSQEVAQGQRFEFGKNWQRFLQVLDDARIAEAERSLRLMLEADSLQGKTFLDVGCGSGLFSLAAMRLGAERVHSFDFDPQSVACAQELKRRYRPERLQWAIEEGSVLDLAYLRRLGKFDVVYAWGVLHHTGRMWQALEAVVPSVARDGKLFLAIYNDQGVVSRFWRRVKVLYNRGPAWRGLIAASFVPTFVVRGLVTDLLRGKSPLRRYREYKKSRGMSIVHDWLDWLGGYPFEVAKPVDIQEFYKARGFRLLKTQSCGRRALMNEYVFVAEN